MAMAKANSPSSMKLKLIVAWGFVGIPLLWGVTQTVINAAALFSK